MTVQPLVLGTRGSALALAQVELVKKALHAVDPAISIEVKKITTSGDRSQTQMIAAKETGAGLKGMFTREIEDALLSGAIDVAVHSLKDLPGQTPAGLEVISVLERADISDILISKTVGGLEQLPVGARIGTSSVRRRKQLLWMRPDLAIEEIRGNVPTRLRKLAGNPDIDAIVLAKAGLDRLGFRIENTGALEFEGTRFQIEILKTLPAIGQGAIALQARADDADTRKILTAINHEPTFLCIRAERELLRLLNGDCHLPIGVRTVLDGPRLHMKAVIFGEDGQPPLAGDAEGNSDAPEALAARLFKNLYD